MVMFKARVRGIARFANDRKRQRRTILANRPPLLKLRRVLFS